MFGYIAAWLGAVMAMAGLDFLWLGKFAKPLYDADLAAHVAAAPKLVAAAAFYAVYPIGVLLFAVRPALASGSVFTALIWGALFGFFNYATYDLTNLAVLRDWPARPLVYDLPWGTVLSAAVAVIGFAIARALHAKGA